MTDQMRWWEDHCPVGPARVFCYLDRWHTHVTVPPNEEDPEPYTYLVAKAWWAKPLCWLHENAVEAECWARLTVEDVWAKMRGDRS